LITHGNKIKLFAGNACPKLAEAIAKKVGQPLGACKVGTFSDGEINVQIGESVRGSDAFIIQSVSPPVNNNLMELLVMIDALRRASAARITAVIPYYGYARQDRKAQGRDPITAKLVADLLTTAGADRVLTMDFHSAQLQGFFDIPVDHLFGTPILAKALAKEAFIKSAKEELIVVSPDVGSVARARQMAQKLNVSLAIVDKRRPKPNMMEVMNIVGDVRGKRCLIVDDMIDTAGTICQGAKALVDVGGAKGVYACCTHAVLSGPAIQRLEESVIEKLFVLNTIELPPEKQISKIAEICVAPIFGSAIKAIFDDSPVSELYEK